MLRQMGENALRQMLHVSVASIKQEIQYFDWSKWRCTLWRYVISHLLSNQTSCQIVQQMGCRYVNTQYSICYADSNFYVNACNILT